MSRAKAWGLVCHGFCSQFLGSDKVVSLNLKACYNIFNLSYLYVMGLLYCGKMLEFEADFAVSPETHEKALVSEIF